MLLYILTARKNKYFIFLRKENFHLYKPTAPNFKKVLADARWYSLKEQVLLPITLAKIKPDLTHFAHYNIPFFWAGKFIVTIYDLTKTEFGKQASNIKNPAVYLTKQTIYNLVLKRAIKNSLKIIAGSESTKNKLISWFKVDDKKTYDLISEGNTIGVFQLESAGMRRLAKDLKPCITSLFILVIPQLL